MSGFETGNVYSKKKLSRKKTYYMAINKRTLITYSDGRFGKYTTKKFGHSNENCMSVAELCNHWNIKLDDFDMHMSHYFQPDEEAKMRARKEKQEKN